MSLLTPLGLLGLLGILILILIYILKPNYQQKIISTSYVWRRSLKFRRKKLPVSRLRNILILLCQVLAITACALILTQPFVPTEEEEKIDETIVVIDASANMRTEMEEMTRFARAIERVKVLAGEISESGGYLTVIVAGNTPDIVLQHAGPDSLTDTCDSLDLLKEKQDTACSWGAGDIKAAMNMAEDILDPSYSAQVYLYTATEYYATGTVKVVDVRQEGEWNAAILNCEVIHDENNYGFVADIACYGRDDQLWLCCEVNGVNLGIAADKDESNSRVLMCKGPISLSGDETVSVAFLPESLQYTSDAYDEYYLLEGSGIYSWQNVHMFLTDRPYTDSASGGNGDGEESVRNLDDSLATDNDYYIYGGEKPTLRIQYSSSLPNDFFGGILLALNYYDRFPWAVEYVQTKSVADAELEGFDVYIFEHKMPAELPTDGLVILMDPDTAPAGAPFDVLRTEWADVDDYALARGEAHPVTAGITLENIFVRKFTAVMAEGFSELAFCCGAPVIFAQNEADSKIFLMSFDLNYSNLAVIKEFPTLIYKILAYYFPPTVSEYAYEVGETIDINARSPQLNINGPGLDALFTEFPAQAVASVPGTYTLTQTPISGKTERENIYVHIPASESNILPSEDVLEGPHTEQQQISVDRDLVFWFAVVLVSLLFAEWWLQTKEHF